MARVVGIGNQSFESIRENDTFYIDKTSFIKEWWENRDVVTLITRPRRFGKTLNMDMIRCFFSNEYKDRGELFEGLDIWKDEKYRELQGIYPVIFLSFATIKQTTYDGAVKKIKNEIINIYNSFDYIMKSDIYNENERYQYRSVCANMSDETAQEALKNLQTIFTDIMERKSSSCLTSTIHLCRRHIQTDTGKNLLPLQEVFLTRLLNKSIFRAEQ